MQKIETKKKEIKEGRKEERKKERKEERKKERKKELQKFSEQRTENVLILGRFRKALRPHFKCANWGHYLLKTFL